MKKWKYKNVIVYNDMSDSLLNEYGQDGWELVSVIHRDFVHELFFKKKRRKKKSVVPQLLVEDYV